MRCKEESSFFMVQVPSRFTQCFLASTARKPLRTSATWSHAPWNKDASSQDAICAAPPAHSHPPAVLPQASHFSPSASHRPPRPGSDSGGTASRTRRSKVARPCWRKQSAQASARSRVKAAPQRHRYPPAVVVERPQSSCRCSCLPGAMPSHPHCGKGRVDSLYLAQARERRRDSKQDCNSGTGAFCTALLCLAFPSMIASDCKTCASASATNIFSSQTCHGHKRHVMGLQIKIFQAMMQLLVACYA